MRDLFDEPEPRKEPPTKRRRQDFRVPAEADTQACKACGAPIAFVRHPMTRTPMVLSLRSVEIRDGERYAETHFADCPDAKRFRKRQ